MKTLPALLFAFALLGCTRASKAPPIPDRRAAPSSGKATTLKPEPGKKAPRRRAPLPSVAAGPRLVQVSNVRSFGGLRWLDPGDVLEVAPPDLTPGIPFLHEYHQRDGTRLRAGHRGPLLTLNGRVVGLAVGSSYVNIPALVRQYGPRLRSLVISSVPSSDAQLRAMVNALAGLPAERLLVYMRADDLDPRRLPLLAPLFPKIYALKMVFPGSPRYGAARSRRDFRQFLRVLPRMTALRWLHVIPFSLQARELAMLRIFAPGEALARIRVTALKYAGGHRVARRLPDPSVLRNLRTLYLAHTPVTDAMLTHVGRLKAVRRVILHYTKITDATLRRLRHLPRLEYLMLAGTRVDGSGLAALKGHRRLVSLCLDDTRVTDPNLRHVAALPALRILRLLGNRQVTDAGIAPLARLANLDTLDLTTTGVRGVGLKAFAQHRSLERLSLSHTPLTDAGAVHLAGITRLEELDLSSTSITDGGLAPLARLKNLRVLRLWSTSITGSGLSALVRLPRLEHLGLSYSHVTDAGLEALRGHPTLKRLSLRNTRVTNRVIALLRTLPALESVDLTDTKVDWRLVEKLDADLDARRKKTP